MYEKAIRRLVEYGCDPNYFSTAVDEANQTLESCIHELAHAFVARVSLDVEADDFDAKLSNRIGSRIYAMNDYQKDRNEEITLAVEMLVLDMLGVSYKERKFVTAVGWNLKNRDHHQQICLARERKATRKHANKVIRYLRRLDAQTSS